MFLLFRLFLLARCSLQTVSFLLSIRRSHLCCLSGGDRMSPPFSIAPHKEEERSMEASSEHWNSRDYLHMLHQFLTVGEALLEQGHDVCHPLCLEVPQITFQQAYLG